MGCAVAKCGNHGLSPRATKLPEGENRRIFPFPKKLPAVIGLRVRNHCLNGYKSPSWDTWQAGSLEWLAKIKMIRKK